MRIRVALPEDAAGVAEVQVASWRSAYRGIVPDAVLDTLSVEASTGGWRQRLVAAPGTILVAEADSRVVGFAASGPVRDDDCDPAATGEVYAIYVVPPWWRRGAGRALWDASNERLRAAGFREVTVRVLEANAPARAFYERIGARLDEGATRHFEAAPGTLLPEVRYRLPLR